MPDENPIDDIRAALRRIGLDLAFLEADHDTAAFAESLAGLAGLFGGDESFRHATDAALGWIGLPAPEFSERLTTWHAWMEEAVTARERGQPLPAWPAALVDGSTPPLPATPDGFSTLPTPGSRPGRPILDDAAECLAVAVLPESPDDELMRMFCVEAEELLAEIEAGVLVLERAPDDSTTLGTVFRGFHTLKGNAAVMKLVVLQRLTHELESLLDAARRGRRPLDRPAIEVILAGADVVSRYVAETLRQLDGHDPGRTILLPIPAVIGAVHTVLATPPASSGLIQSEAPASADPVVPAAGATTVTADIRQDSVIAAEATAFTLPPDQGAAAPGSPRGGADTGLVPDQPDQPVQPRMPTPGTASVRVDTHKLDGLVDLVGELVIAQSMVFQAAEAAGGEASLGRCLSQLRGITAELQRTAMAMRMIPIRNTFQKMGRLVRDVAVQLGKDIRLTVEGEETELDRTVIEEIGDPLVHMVRNAADHGIELPAERIAAGKSPAGTITLKAFHQGGFVVIEVADDGRGLDPVRLRRKGIERGLVTPDATLDDREAFQLIFAPGFSTAEQVTDVSGRGVGMDVVRRNIERVRGKVAIDSAPGQGSRFTISMPLTLAIIEGLIVSVAGQRFVIPTLAVRESFRPEAGGVTTVHGRGELVDVRGRQLPLLRLGRHLGITGAEESPDRGIVVVLEAGYELRCLLVDELVGKQEVVIKGLGETFAGRSGFAGAAILGDGRIGLILDTTALVRLGRGTSETAA